MNRFFRKNRRRLILFSFDLVCFCVLNLFYFFIVSSIGSDCPDGFGRNPFLVNAAILCVSLFGLRLFNQIYSNVWRYSHIGLYLRLVLSDAAACLVCLPIARFAFVKWYFGLWYYFSMAALTALVTLSSRFVYHILYSRIRMNDSVGKRKKTSVAIVGAGQIGALLAAELQCNELSAYQPVLFIDNDPSKIGNRVCGLKVYSPDERILDVLSQNDVAEIFIAMPGMDSEKALSLYQFYSQTSCKIKLYDMPLRDASDSFEGKRRVIREFQIEDLLFRKSHEDSAPLYSGYYEGKTVLVTGGGGSIGSEICRQIAKCHPKLLIILDIYENNAYEIQQELIRTYGAALNFRVVIASVRDRVRLEDVFAEYRPDVVFHAAAHKHVPLMENNPTEAVKNNVFGTRNTADMAEKYGVKKFILISTDKAVNPTNVMGASKRMCEMIVQSRCDSNTDFAAVRFGNVLGSNGSVIPLFKRQIAAGGPVTITDKRIIRYFMTIPEASQLVISAGAMAKKGELFVLDMGKPVRIYDLAVNMIRLSGFVPEKEIRIKEIGLRPGEKLYEELLIKTEDLNKTENNLIFVEKDQPLPREEIDEKLRILTDALQKASDGGGDEAVKDAMRFVVPTFTDPETVNRKAEQSAEMRMSGAGV